MLGGNTPLNRMKIFKNYLFRLVIGANDHSSRNFITDGNNIYSIDDHCLDIDFKDLNLKMRLKKCLLEFENASKKIS